MSFDDYVLHMRQKCTLAVAIAVCNTKPADLTIDEYIQQLRNKLRPDDAMDVDSYSICSQDFDISDENVISLDDDNTQIQDLPDSFAILEGFDIEQLINGDEIEKNTIVSTSKGHEIETNTIVETSNDVNTQMQDLPDSLDLLDGCDIEQLIKGYEIEKNTIVATSKGHEIVTNSTVATSKGLEIEKNTRVTKKKENEREKNIVVAKSKGHEVEKNTTLETTEAEDTMELLRDIDRVMPRKEIVQRNIEKMPSTPGHIEVLKTRIIGNVLVAPSNSKALSQEINNRKRPITDDNDAKTNDDESQETQVYTVPNNFESYVSETQDVRKFDILEKYIFGVKKPKVQGKQDNVVNSQNIGRKADVHQDNKRRIDEQNDKNDKITLCTSKTENDHATVVKSKEVTNFESCNMVEKKGTNNTIKRFQNTNIVDILLGDSQMVNANKTTKGRKIVLKNSRETEVKRQNNGGIKIDMKGIKDGSTTQHSQIADIGDGNTRTTNDNNNKVQQVITDKSSSQSVGQKHIVVIQKNNGDKNNDSKEITNTKTAPNTYTSAIQHGDILKAGNIKIITDNNFSQSVDNTKVKTHDIAVGTENWDHIPNTNKDTEDYLSKNIADLTIDSGMGKTNYTGTQDTQNDEFTFTPIINSVIRTLNSQDDEYVNMIEKRTQEIDTPKDDNRKSIDIQTYRRDTSKEFRSDNMNVDELENIDEDENSMDKEEGGEADRESNIVPYKVIMEMNKIKGYLKRSNENLNSNDSVYRIQRTQELSFLTEASSWVDQAGHCMLDYIISCPMTQSNLHVVEQISKVLGELVDRLHAECNSPSFLDDILQHITRELKHIYEEDDVVFGKEERMERILLLNRSIHIIIFTTEEIARILESFHGDVTSSAMYEVTDIEHLQNSCHLFHALEILLGRYFNKKQQFTKMACSQSQKESESSQPLRNTITEIWKKKWDPTFGNNNTTKLDVGANLDCMKISEILNRIVMDRMDGYCLVSFAALQCYNLLQS